MRCVIQRVTSASVAIDGGTSVQNADIAKIQAILTETGAYTGL